MPLKFVVGLFQSEGTAEDARNRLKTEGVPADNIALLLLHEIASPVPATVASELATLSVDPMIVGNVRETYAEFIRNGETAIFVRTHGESEIELAVDILRMFFPIRIRVVTPGVGKPHSEEVR